MPTPDPRHVLSISVTLAASLYSLGLVTAEQSAVLLTIVLASGPLLLIPLIRRVLPRRALRVSLIAAALGIVATHFDVDGMAGLSLSLSLLALAISLSDVATTDLSPDLYAASFAVGSGFAICLNGIILIAATGSQAPRWALYSLAIALALLATLVQPSSSTGSATGSLWLFVALGALPIWTDVAGLSNTAAWPSAAVLLLLMCGATLAMTLLPTIDPSRHRAIFVSLLVCAAVGSQFDATSVPAAGLGLFVLPFLLRTVAMHSTAAVSRFHVAGFDFAAVLTGLAFGSKLGMGRWPLGVSLGPVVAGAVLLFSLTRKGEQTSYVRAQPSLLHWPGVMIAIGVTGSLAWFLSQ